MHQHWTDTIVDLGDGRIAFVEYPYDDEYPAIQVLPREHYDRMERVREERRELRRQMDREAARSRAAKRERMQAKLSPGAFKLWLDRRDPTYWMRKVWNSESMQKQLYSENPFLSLLPKKALPGKIVGNEYVIPITIDKDIVDAESTLPESSPLLSPPYGGKERKGDAQHD